MVLKTSQLIIKLNGKKNETREHQVLNENRNQCSKSSLRIGVPDGQDSAVSDVERQILLCESKKISRIQSTHC